MRVFSKVDGHDDDRRSLAAFRPPTDFPRVVEGKVLITKKKGVRLGNHSHPYVEGFFLVVGGCTVRTWTQEGGAQERELESPCMFMFEAGEEHVLTCSEGMVLIGYMPITFEEDNSVPAENLQ